MILSYFALRVRFVLVHFIGVVVALIGVGCMVGADVLTGKEGTDQPGNCFAICEFVICSTLIKKV